MTAVISLYNIGFCKVTAQKGLFAREIISLGSPKTNCVDWCRRFGTTAKYAAFKKTHPSPFIQLSKAGRRL